jgi:hypothetical protein
MPHTNSNESTTKGMNRGKSAKGVNGLELVPVKEGDKIVGITFNGPIPFDAFTDEKEGSEFTVYVDGEGKTVRNPTQEQIDSGEVMADDRQATPHRDLRKRYTNAEIIWPDGKIRTIAVQLKANAPVTPEEFAARAAERGTKQVAASVAKLTPAQIQERINLLQAELEGRTE